MKLLVWILVSAFAWITPLTARAYGERVLEECTAERIVDDEHFEESFSVEQNSELLIREDSAEGLSVTVGANRDWAERTGDSVRVLPSSRNETRYAFSRKGSRDEYVVAVTDSSRSRSGKLYLKESGARRARLIAILACE